MNIHSSSPRSSFVNNYRFFLVRCWVAPLPASFSPFNRIFVFIDLALALRSLRGVSVCLSLALSLCCRARRSAAGTGGRPETERNWKRKTMREM